MCSSVLDSTRPTSIHVAVCVRFSFSVPPPPELVKLTEQLGLQDTQPHALRLYLSLPEEFCRIARLEGHTGDASFGSVKPFMVSVTPGIRAKAAGS